MSEKTAAQNPRHLPEREGNAPQSTYEMGDKVYLDLGQSGEVGPGVVSGRLEFDDDTEAYEVRMPVTEDRSIYMAWYPPTWLRPAETDMKYLKKS